jgi:hypothetical protein
MGWFGPMRIVTAADGSKWEIYVYRFRLPSWRPVDYDSSQPPASQGFGVAVFAAVDALLSLINDLLIPFLRMLVTAPLALLRSSRSSRRRIEALTVWPHEERYAWEMDAADVERDRRCVETSKFAQPARAVFLGRCYEIAVGPRAVG